MIQEDMTDKEVSACMTPEERIESLHARMELFRRRREQQKIVFPGAVSAGIAICLMLIIFRGRMLTGGPAILYSGSIMLFDNAGGYVLTAVAAFMAGAILTTVIIRKRNHEKDSCGKSSQGPDNEGTEG